MNYVENNLLLQDKKDIKKKDVVHNHAKISLEQEKKPVYNITVDKDGVYYANGILVSNCDAVTMLIENYSLRKFGEPEKKYFDEEANKEYDSPYHQMVSNITGGVINDEMFDWRNW